MFRFKKCIIIVLLVLFCSVPAVYAENDINMNLTTNSTTTATQDTTNTTTPDTTTQPESAIVSSMPSGSDGELGITGIINILLITVGVILIFLAIAILIRLK